MIHLSRHDVFVLWAMSHPPKAEECNTSCGVCEMRRVCETLDRVKDSKFRSSEEAAKALYNACAYYREYTDVICDTYTCPNCPNYAWCTTLRGIAIEGVKLDEG